MDNKIKKTVYVTVAVIVVFFSAVILLIWFKLPHELPLWLLFVLILAPAGILIGTVMILLRRLGSPKR
jgi:ABC-type multidrug transport system permease subunit